MIVKIMSFSAISQRLGIKGAQTTQLLRKNRNRKKFGNFEKPENFKNEIHFFTNHNVTRMPYPEKADCTSSCCTKSKSRSKVTGETGSHRIQPPAKYSSSQSIQGVRYESYGEIQKKNCQIHHEK